MGARPPGPAVSTDLDRLAVKLGCVEPAVWIDRLDRQVAATLDVLEAMGRTSDAVDCMLAHLARTDHVRIYAGNHPYLVIAVEDLEDRRGLAQLHVVRRLLRHQLTVVVKCDTERFGMRCVMAPHPNTPDQHLFASKGLS